MEPSAAPPGDAARALISPHTMPIVEPVLQGIEPERKETLAPAEAFARHGVPTPAELRARASPEAS